MRQNQPEPLAMRPRVLAGAGLLLDLVRLLKEATRLDYDSLVMLCVVSVAARGSLPPAESIPRNGRGQSKPHARGLIKPSAEFEGSVSRLAIARATGLPRETVRRKINHMIAQGLLEVVARGSVRPTRMLSELPWQKFGDDGFDAVKRYDETLRSLGSRGIFDK